MQKENKKVEKVSYQMSSGMNQVSRKGRREAEIVKNYLGQRRSQYF